MREQARKRHAQSLLERTVKDSKQIGQARSEGTGAFEMLTHASQTADLDAPANKSLFLFKINSPFRLQAARIQASPAFSNGVTCLILFSCVSLAVEGPGEGSTGWVQENVAPFFELTNAAVLVCFVLEALLKCIVHGCVLVSGPTIPYLASKANRVDFFIILLCTLSYIDFVPLDGAATRALRVGRVITPIVNLAKQPSIKVVFVSFVRAGPDTAVVLLPLAILGLIFATVGVANFGSGFKRCVSAAEPLVELHNNRTLCDLEPDGVWQSPPFHFDDVLHGMATLFTALTDGAHGYMVATVDYAGVSGYAYWVAFHFVFTCFFLNLFIGVLSASFAKSSGTSLRTLGEKQWVAAKLTVSQFRPQKSETEELGPNRDQKTCCKVIPIPAFWLKLRVAMFAAATNSRLENCWRLAIVANSALLATERYPRSATHAALVETCNSLFLGVYTLEVIIKLTGFGPAYYFGHGWLVSDFLLVVISISLKLFGVQSGVECLRMIRVFRLVVLLAKVPDLASLVETLVRCINASFALLFISGLIVYVYAIIGMTTFGLLPESSRLEASGLSDSEEYRLRKAETIIAFVCPHCENYTDATNFSSFFNAFKLLVQAAFGQGIGGFITDMTFLGADFWSLFIYFSTFYGVCVWICFNLLIVTVLDNFSAAIPLPAAARVMQRTCRWRFAHCHHTRHVCACLSFALCLTTFDTRFLSLRRLSVCPHHNANAFSACMRRSSSTVSSNFWSKYSTVSFPPSAVLRQALNARYRGKFASVLASTFAAPTARLVLYAQSDHAAMADESTPCCNALTTQVAACLNRKPSATEDIQPPQTRESCKRLSLSTTFCITWCMRAVSCAKHVQRSNARA